MVILVLDRLNYILQAKVAIDLSEQRWLKLGHGYSGNGDVETGNRGLGNNSFELFFRPHHDIEERFSLLGWVVQAGKGAMSLGVSVDEENFIAHQCQGRGNIESRSGFPDASFLIGDRDDKGRSSKAQKI